MTYADFASLAQHPDFLAAAKAGRVKAAAKLLEFEHAAYLRDKIKKLQEGK